MYTFQKFISEFQDTQNLKEIELGLCVAIVKVVNTISFIILSFLVHEHGITIYVF